MTAPLLRAATADDALLLSVLATQVFLETYAPRGITAQLAREVRHNVGDLPFARLLADARVDLLIAERGAHAVGLAQLHRASPPPIAAAGDLRVELQRLYVRQADAGAGVGKALLRACEDRAVRSGAAGLWLTAWSGNARALAFYARQGYEDRGATDYVFEDERFENRVLVRSLRPA